MTSLSRFQMVEPYRAALPAKCAVNGEVSKKLIDFGFFIEGYGHIQICVDCIQSMCNELGYLSPSQVKEINEKLELLNSINLEILDENKRLRDAVDTIRNLSAPITVPSIPELPVVENMEGNSTSKPEGKNRSTKQTAKSGSSHVHSFDGSNFLDDL